jgi:hypothetical protein
MKQSSNLLTILLMACIFGVILSGCHRSAPPQPVSGNNPPVKNSSSKLPHAKKVGHDSDVRNGHADNDGDHDEEAHRHFAAQGALVTDHGIPLLRESQHAGGFTPERRAQIVAERLNNMATTHGLEPGVLSVRRVKGYPTVFFFHKHDSSSQGHVLATVDPRTAKQFGFANHPEVLAYWWRDIMRDHALVIAGSPPRWTTRYAQPMQQLYDFCQKEQRGVPSHESFERALSKLSPAEREILSNLYMSVPDNYQYVIDSPKLSNHKLSTKTSKSGESHHQHH